MRVLDVGCGPGPITLDVAALISPGIVTGVDRLSSAIEKAQVERESRNVTNAEFQVSEANPLPFDDDTFDLTYSHSLLEYVQNPVEALAEQSRVTKPGGTVVAGIGIYETITYPECRTRQRVADAYRRLAPGSEGLPYFNREWGYQAPHLMAQAGLVDVVFAGYVAPIDFAYQGSEYLDYNLGKLRIGIDTEGAFGQMAQASANAAGVSAQSLKTSLEEVEAWRNHRFAFFLRPEVIASGRVS
jgi:SAM-dependent methyltransferase